jgi:hypothetical protein
MNILRKDLNFGLGCENLILETIKTYFNDDIKKNNNKYAFFDFMGNDCMYELKSRRVNHNTYSTTIFPKHKIDNTDSLNKKRVLLFGFNDGLYYIEYDKKVFDTFKISNRRYRTDRYYNGKCIDKEIDYYEIPIEFLKVIS